MQNSTEVDPESNRQIVEVDLKERSYPIVIGCQVASLIVQHLQQRLPRCRHSVLIHDERLSALADSVKAGLQRGAWRVTQLIVPSGESSKSLAEAERLWESMLAERTDRGSCVIAIGGGVVGDLAGFVAASYARGIPLVQVPTTLLSQVDSSVGGKTAINLPGAKNIVGAFWQPTLVVIDTDALDTLPEREFVSGLAEVVKYGVILLPDLFEYLEQNTTAILQREDSCLVHIIAESCRAKARVVQEDERETSGRRAILNYGHTFAHALESATGYGTLLHGEAVAIGMHIAAHLACQLGRISPEFVERQRRLLQQFNLPRGLPEGVDVDPSKLWSLMQSDKKVEHGTLRFVLPTRLGHVEIVAAVEQASVSAAIQAALSDI